MKEENENTGFPEEKTQPQNRRNGLLRDFLDGTLLTRESVVRQLPFILFITFLLVVYIGNRYQAEKIVRRIDSLETEVKELRAEALFVASEYNRLNKPSEVYKLLKERGIGLVESTEPPIKLKAGKLFKE